MPIDLKFDRDRNIETLFLSKRLEPLTKEQVETVAKIAACDVTGFSEAEVRSFIIDPITRVLGYEKNSIFSLNLEHPLKFHGRSKYPDYQVTLWNENFWLIEAKRPTVSLDYDALSQALEYAAHPTVNAALLVLCNGLMFDVYDREESVERPILSIEIRNIATEFDKVRVLLEPIQSWFFQKRRLVRLADKVLDNEFNMSRLEEFNDVMSRRITAKRQTVIENFRKTTKLDNDADLKKLETQSPVEIIDLYLFYEIPWPLLNAATNRLVQLSAINAFHVMYKMLPDEPREVDDAFLAHALYYLLRLRQSGAPVSWIANWLALPHVSNRNLDDAIRILLRHCLTHFEGYETPKLVLLANYALRRISKLLNVLTNSVRNQGLDLHALARHTLPEFSWAQLLASPEREIIGQMDAQVRLATYRFVRDHSGENCQFLAASAKQFIQGLWAFERALLGKAGNYAQLRRERSLGDMQMTEHAGVTYDNLGHYALVMMSRFPEWKSYLMEQHSNEVQVLAALGSWAAKDLIGVPHAQVIAPLADDVLADRFFLGDQVTLRILRSAYRGT